MIFNFHFFNSTKKLNGTFVKNPFDGNNAIILKCKWVLFIFMQSQQKMIYKAQFWILNSRILSLNFIFTSFQYFQFSMVYAVTTLPVAKYKNHMSVMVLCHLVVLNFPFIFDFKQSKHVVFSIVNITRINNKYDKASSFLKICKV